MGDVIWVLCTAIIVAFAVLKFNAMKRSSDIERKENQIRDIQADKTIEELKKLQNDK